LQSCASAYASKAGRAYDNFAWRNFAQPLQRLVRELAAKLELPQ
jgi:hypothetical protein